MIIIGNITIVDALCGKGKTQYAIQMMNDNPDKKYIYITPYLDEVSRVKGNTISKFFEPETQKGSGKKSNHLKLLIEKGKNIVCTHSLFSQLDYGTELLLKNKKYTLIMDEVFEVVKKLDIKSDDIDIVMSAKCIEINDKGMVSWVGKDNYAGSIFTNIKYMCDMESLYMYNNQFFFWTFPYRIFDYFEETYVLTYLFNAQIQRYYYDMFNIAYTYCSVYFDDRLKKYRLTEYGDDYDDRKILKEKIHIYNGIMNENYFLKRNKFDTELSASWLRKADDISVKQLSDNLNNYFRNMHNAKGKDILWTTLKDVKDKLKGKGYTKRYIALNTRATNNYSESKVIAYIFNRYMNPIEENFFKYHGVNVNEDLLAVSDLIQYIFRSTIRNGNDINIYIPSKRMRDLLIQYLEGEI